MHLAQYEVDAANFDPSAKTTKRPDTAKRLTEAHAALSHSQWLEHKVGVARAGLADGTNQRIAPEEWEKVRETKRKPRDAL